MPHSLEQRVDDVRRAALRQLRWEAAWRWLAAVILIIASAALVDVIFRFDDRVLRVLVAVSCWLAVGWCTGKLLLPALWATIPQLEIALRLERFYPILQHRLASAVEFLGQPLDDTLSGSAALRRGVVIDAQALSEGLDFAAVIDRRPARLAVIGLGIVAGVIAVLVAADLALHLPTGRPASAGIALRRLVLPLGDLDWPRQNYLAVKRPITKIARGADFELEVVDRYGAPLPADVRAEFRNPDGSLAVEPLSPAGRAALVRRPQVERSFAYRIVGGDDQSFPWTDVEVLPPPESAELAVRIHPPAYLGWPPETSPPLIRAIRGTRVELNGAATAPLNRATICLEDGKRLPAAVGKDRRAFHLAADADEPLIVENSGAYWIELESTDGVQGGRDTRYEIRAIADAPPRVTIPRPAGNLYVTPHAAIPLDVAAADDLAIRRIGLRYKLSDATEADGKSIALFEGAEASSAPRTDGVPDGEERAVSHVLELSPLGLAPGVQLSVVAFAADYLPQEGASTERQFSIITPDDLLKRLGERQSLILNELARLLRLQYEAHAQVEAVQVAWKHEAKAQALDLERLQAGELTQRQVARGLTDDRDGVAALVAAALLDLQINQLDNSDLRRQLEDIQAVLRALGDGPLPELERDFTASVKSLQRGLDQESSDAAAQASGESAPRVDQIALAQRQVIENLEALLARLTRWDALRRQVRELAQLRQDHAKLTEDTLAIGRQTLARSLRELAPPERAELERLSLAQSELARRLDNILQALAQVAEDLASTDAAAAQTIQDALVHARREAPSAAMRSAARGVAENQIGQATVSQEQAAASIDALLDALTNRQERELSRQVEQLGAAVEALRALQARQQTLREQLSSTPPPTDDDLRRIAAEQRALAEDAQRAARELDRLPAGAAPRLTESAAAEMRSAATQAEAGAPQDAAAAADLAQQSLAAAQQALENASQAARRQLAEQAMDQLQGTLRQLEDGQRRILQETVRLESRRREFGDWSRAELAEVRALSSTQAELSALAVEAAEALGHAAVLQRVLTQSADAMRTAETRLAAQDAGDVTQAAQNQALTRLAQLREALTPPSPQPNDAPQRQQGSASPEGDASASQTPPDALQRLAELQMLRLLQIEVHERTKELEDRRRRQGNLTAEEQAQLNALSAEQTTLADLLTKLSTPEPSE